MPKAPKRPSRKAATDSKTPRRPSPKELAAMTNKQVGEDLVIPASEIKDMKIVRYPTGLLTLDRALAGGFPASTFNIISGLESAGKDALLNCVIRTHQRLYKEKSHVLYCYTEPGGYDKHWARKQGVSVCLSEHDIRSLEAGHGRPFPAEYRTKLGEQIGTFNFIESKDMLKVLEAILFNANHGCPLIILNSAEGIGLDKYIDNDEMEQGSHGLQKAAIWTQFSEKWGLRGGNRWPGTLLITRQARANLHTYGWRAKAWTSKHGSHMVRHFMSMGVELTGLEKITRGSGSSEEVVGKKVKWDLIKGKHGAHEGVKGECKLYHATGVDAVDDLLEGLLDAGLARLNFDKSKIIIDHDGEKLEGSRADLASKIRMDTDLFMSLYKEGIKALRIPILYFPLEDS